MPMVELLLLVQENQHGVVGHIILEIWDEQNFPVRKQTFIV